jgi:hypothetical protein
MEATVLDETLIDQLLIGTIKPESLDGIREDTLVVIITIKNHRGRVAREFAIGSLKLRLPDLLPRFETPPTIAAPTSRSAATMTLVAAPGLFMR